MFSIINLFKLSCPVSTVSQSLSQHPAWGGLQGHDGFGSSAAKPKAPGTSTALSKTQQTANLGLIQELHQHPGLLNPNQSLTALGESMLLPPPAQTKGQGQRGCREQTWASPAHPTSHLDGTSRKLQHCCWQSNKSILQESQLRLTGGRTSPICIYYVFL